MIDLDGHPADFAQEIVLGGELVLARSDEDVANRAVAIDQKRRRPRDVPGVDADAVPHAVALEDLASVVDEQIKGKARLFDVPLDLLGPLRDDCDDRDAGRAVFGSMAGQLAELAAAVRSPGSAVEHEEHGTTREVAGERLHDPARGRQRKVRGAVTHLQRIARSRHLTKD